MRRNLLLMVVIALASTELAQGKECKGVNLPDQVQVAGSTLVLNGLGLRQATMLKVNVYVGALYLTKTSNDASAILASNTPKQIVLHFVRSVGGDDIAKGWSEGFEKNAKAELPALKAWADLQCLPCFWGSAERPCKRSAERESDVLESPDRTPTIQAPRRSSTRSWTAM